LAHQSLTAEAGPSMLFRQRRRGWSIAPFTIFCVGPAPVGSCVGRPSFLRSLISCAAGFVVLSFLLALAACRSTTAPEHNPSGEHTALFSGAVVDTFRAVGAEPPPTREPVTFASARPGAEAGIFGIMGLRARAGVQDILLLELHNVTGPGVYAARGSFQHGVQASILGSGRIFEITAGEIEITSVTGERLGGAFAGTAVERIVRFPPPAHPDTIWIAEGRFDVPVLPFAR
jgi:hypothetical protein